MGTRGPNRLKGGPKWHGGGEGYLLIEIPSPKKGTPRGVPSPRTHTQQIGLSTRKGLKHAQEPTQSISKTTTGASSKELAFVNI